MFARLLLQLLLAGFAASPVFAQGQPSGLAKATFAAGCFWCTEEAMDKVPGVISTTSGYMGGSKKNPTYPEVSSGATLTLPTRRGWARFFEASATQAFDQ